MRDPKRILGIVETLRVAWEENPDLRLGQLIVNAARRSYPDLVCPALFYIEDAELVAGILGKPVGGNTNAQKD